MDTVIFLINSNKDDVGVGHIGSLLCHIEPPIVGHKSESAT